MSASYKADFSGINLIKKRLKENYSVRVGVLGDKNQRDGELSNSDIGLKHELGVPDENIPRRSFLRDPLTKNKKQLIKTFESDLAKEAIENFDFKLLYKLIGIQAEAIIQEAFATRGFGEWLPNSPLTVKLKGSDSPLIDTAELRKSISSEVVSK
ncbi:MAG: hypothetical protein R3D71_05960 [Rickettsiales bacterium]